ncbi:MAG: iron-sulfur cluster assembly accessory protein [bacterium]|nr:iron-sulfur cluster assembly accessory protein [bacterium]
MIEMSDKVVAKIKELVVLNKLPEATGGMRLGLKGGGCAGFKYFFKPEASPESDDTIFEENGARLFVDPESLKFVDGSKIDWGWVDHLMGEGLKIDNPKTGGGCGCGVSISF